MSDKKVNLERESSLLKKKTNRKKKTVQKLESFDMKKFKEKFLNELSQFYEKSILKEEDVKVNFDLTSEYERKYKEYLQEGFTINTANFINRIIIESISLPQALRTNFALHKILTNVVKSLMMNEIEIVYFSLYLDKIGWITEGYQIDENLMITGLSVKIYLNSNYDHIVDHLGQKMKIKERFDNWLKLKEDYKNFMTITPRELNERYSILSRPFNIYCKQNYIDYNFVVDQILQMSLPYSEGRPASEKVQSQENTIYEPVVSVNKDTFKTQHVPQPIATSQIKFPQQYSMMNLSSLQNSNFEGLYFNPNTSSDAIKPTPVNINDNNISVSNFQNFFKREYSILREGSFILNADERFLPTRGPSQIFPVGNEDMAENVFSRNNQMANRFISSQSLGNEYFNLQPSFYNNLEIGQGTINENNQESRENKLIKQEVEETDGQAINKLEDTSNISLPHMKQDNNDKKQFSFENENKVEIKKELSEDVNAVALSRNDSDKSKSSEILPNPLRLSFTNEDKKDKTLLKKFINMKNEQKN